MNILSLAAAAALVALAVNADAAATAPVPIKLVGVTGIVQIKTAGGIMNVKAGDPAIEVPSGAEVIVVSGDAVVESGGVVVKADVGDSFTIKNDKGIIDIAATGGSVSVIGADGVTKEVPMGKGLATPQGAVASAPEPKAPESIPADPDDGELFETGPAATSPAQEKAATEPACVPTVSPSNPC